MESSISILRAIISAPMIDRSYADESAILEQRRVVPMH
jgi:hypothetical protein